MFSAIRAYLDRGLLPSERYIEWTVEVFEFLLRRFGGLERLRETPVFLPTPEHFDVRTDLGQAEIAATLFAQTRAHCGMEEWPVDLAPHLNRNVDHGLFGTTTRSGAAGTFSKRRDGAVEITYDPEKVNNPTSLVATFAHELSHYLLHSLDEVTPGGPELEEPATDITAVFLGFGVFLANSAFEFAQFTDVDRQGWSYSMQGYLSEDELAFALALFARLTDTPLRDFRGFLDPNPRAAAAAADRYLTREPTAWERLLG